MLLYTMHATRLDLLQLNIGTAHTTHNTQCAYALEILFRFYFLFLFRFPLPFVQMATQWRSEGVWVSLCKCHKFNMRNPNGEHTKWYYTQINPQWFSLSHTHTSEALMLRIWKCFGNRVCAVCMRVDKVQRNAKIYFHWEHINLFAIELMFA